MKFVFTKFIKKTEPIFLNINSTIKMATNRSTKLTLKSVNKTHPSIEVTSTDPFFLGRSPDSSIQDTCVSRKHINLFADFETKSVKLKVLGVNPSALNGTIMERNKEYTAVENDIIEVLHTKYPYKLCFFQESDVMVKISPVKTSTDPEDDASKKRKLSSPGEQLTAKRRKWTMDIFPDVKQPFSDDDNWQSFNKGQLIVYTMAGCKASSKIAAYDMDGTLITTKSGKVFPKNADDWRIAFGTAVTTLKAKFDDNYKIAILTNQAGVTSGKTKLIDLKTKIENIAQALKVPLQAFIATGDSSFRKPLPGMWQALCHLKNDNIEVDLAECFYVGDAAGRPENKLMKRKKDHSLVDRLLALNVGLTFLTPEEHFLKTKTEKWVEPEFIPASLNIDNVKKAYDLEKFNLNSDEPEIIVMVGGPGSGKSFFCKENLGSNGYEVVSRDKLGSWQKCVDRLNDSLKAGKKVAVDNTNGTKEARMRYIVAAQKLKVPCRCFVMATSHKHALHNNAFRELTDPSHAKISSIVVNGFKKNYEPPKLNEGFTEIVNIEFLPKFENDSDRLLYNMFLLSS